MLGAVDIAIVLAFLAYAVISGLRSRESASRGLEEYFLAGRSLRGWEAGMSMAATQFAADTPLLVTGMIAVGGLFSLWRLWIYALAFLLMGFVLAAAWRRSAVLTDAELAEVRYGTRGARVLRTVKAIYFGGVFNCTVLAMVLLASARIAEPFLRWEEWLPAPAFDVVVALVRASGISLASGGDAIRGASNLLSLLAVVGVTTFYSTTGGLRAVVRTDVVQLVVALVASFVYAAVAIDRAGGLAHLPASLADIYGPGAASELLAITPSRARDAGWLVIGTIAIQWLAQMNADGTGYLAQRSMACRTERDARHAAVVFVVLQVLLRSWMWIAIGLALLVLLPAHGELVVAEREATFVDGIARYLPEGARGLMLAGLVAALASTLDTHLNWGGAYFTNDLYRPFMERRGRSPSPKRLVAVARASNLVILVLAGAILTQLDSIQSAWHASLLLGAGMGVALVLRWLWWRVNAASELAAIAVSTVLAPILLATLDHEGTRLIVVALASTAAAVIAALAGSSAPHPALHAFYRRVRPPGYWGPVAVACGDDPRAGLSALMHGLFAVASAALSIWCVLVAGSTLVFGSPAPTWFPWRGAWIASLFAIAVFAALAAHRTLRAFVARTHVAS